MGNIVPSKGIFFENLKDFLSLDQDIIYRITITDNNNESFHNNGDCYYTR